MDTYSICVIGGIICFWSSLCIMGFVGVTGFERLLELGRMCYVAGLTFVFVSLFDAHFSMPSLYEWGIIFTTVILFVGSSLGSGMLLGKLHLFFRYRKCEIEEVNHTHES